MRGALFSVLCEIKEKTGKFTLFFILIFAPSLLRARIDRPEDNVYVCAMIIFIIYNLIFLRVCM